MSFITAVLVLLCVLPFLANFFKPSKSKGQGKAAPGPRSWPIVGNLLYIGKFQDLAAAFCALTRTYGDVASFKLGVFDAVLVSGWKNFKDVLITNGHIFDGRPDFIRFNLLFGNNKDNSLAFADGSNSLHQHRNTISPHSLMKKGQAFFENFENAVTPDIFSLIEAMKSQAVTDPSMDIKPQLSKHLASIFCNYFLTTEVNMNDPIFISYVDSMDQIFQEINAECIGDVLPFFMKFINKSFFVDCTHSARNFFMKRVMEPRIAARAFARESLPYDENNNCTNDSKADMETPNDLLTALLDALEKDPEASFEHSLYALEDIIGGHAAIANSIPRILHRIAQNPEVQKKIRQEVQANASANPTINDRLVYVEAVIWEALRFIASPIVPHKAMVDTNIDGFAVKQGTLVFFNNHDLNFSPELWDQPEKFMPERFISEEGRIRKPEFFVPFSTGKRSCLGYRTLINISTTLVANLCQNFEIEVDPTANYNFPRGVIAVGRNPIPFIYKLIE